MADRALAGVWSPLRWGLAVHVEVMGEAGPGPYTAWAVTTPPEVSVQGPCLPQPQSKQGRCKAMA